MEKDKVPLQELSLSHLRLYILAEAAVVKMVLVALVVVALLEQDIETV